MGAGWGCRSLHRPGTRLPNPRPEPQRWGDQELTALLESLSKVAPAVPQLQTSEPSARLLLPPHPPQPISHQVLLIRPRRLCVSTSKLDFYLRRQTFPIPNRLRFLRYTLRSTCRPRGSRAASAVKSIPGGRRDTKTILPSGE